MGKLLLDMKISPVGVAVVVGAIALIVLYVLMKDHFDKKKGFDSEEKKAVEEIIRKLAPEGENLTAVYANWEESVYQVGSTTTKYWYYAIGFNENVLCVVPLIFHNDDMSCGDCCYIRKEQLGMINASAKANWVELYDKEQKLILNLIVEERNTRLDSYNPVNIQQPEETKAFLAWRDRWMAEVNAANGVTVSGKIGKPVGRKKN